jgi:endonuclease/exonuclease/phosphatase family metal-dependent hydrolase
MPKNITIATFNCENLFKRFKFSSKASQAKKDDAIENGFIINKDLFDSLLPEEKELTAQAIKATNADIICLQEVENLDTLKSFQSQFLAGKYPYKYLIDGNDPRLIDVAVLSKVEATHLITHQYDKKGKTPVFSRDCLEIEFNIEGKPLTLFVNHFKSMLDKADPKAGRENTMAKRKIQSERVVEIITNKFGNDPSNGDFIVLGDLNDYMPSKGLAPLLSRPWLENVVARLDPAEQWTHYWDGAPKTEDPYKQIDYLLLSKKLATQNPNALPSIIRKGLCTNAKKYTGERFAGVGKKNPAASDHCPIAITITI